MKKRIQTLMFLTLMAFLFSGLTSLSAQSFTTGPAEYSGVNGKTLIDYLDTSAAFTTIETELQTNYGTTQPAEPTNLATAEVYYQVQYLRAVGTHLSTGETTAAAIYRGYNEVVNMSKGNYPNLVDQTWQDDMISLLSN